jgi:hypothetical protein
MVRDIALALNARIKMVAPSSISSSSRKVTIASAAGSL